VDALCRKLQTSNSRQLAHRYTHYICTVSLDKQGKKSSATLSSQSHSDGSEKTGYGWGGGGWSFEVGQVRWNHVDRQAVPSNDGLNI
jgi:hypothetical protein